MKHAHLHTSVLEFFTKVFWKSGRGNHLVKLLVLFFLSNGQTYELLKDHIYISLGAYPNCFELGNRRLN